MPPELMGIPANWMYLSRTGYFAFAGCAVNEDALTEDSLSPMPGKVL